MHKRKTSNKDFFLWSLFVGLPLLFWLIISYMDSFDSDNSVFFKVSFENWMRIVTPIIISFLFGYFLVQRKLDFRKHYECIEKNVERIRVLILDDNMLEIQSEENEFKYTKWLISTRSINNKITYMLDYEENPVVRKLISEVKEFFDGYRDAIDNEKNKTLAQSKISHIESSIDKIIYEIYRL